MIDFLVKWPALLAVAAVILYGCNTSDDPSQGGFISGVQGLGTGAYEKRVREKRDMLESEEERRHRLLEEKRRAQQEHAAQSEAQRAATQQLDQLEASLGQLDRALKQARGAEQADTDTLNRLQSEVDDMSLQRELIKNDPVTQDAEKLKRLQALTWRKQRLEEALAEALAN